MGSPKTFKHWTVTGKDKDFDGLEFKESDIPKLADNEVLVKLHAASLNYRDLIIPKGQYPFPTKFPVIAGSDGAGEVVEVGSNVSRWKKGDKVTTLFHQDHQYGPVTLVNYKTGLGGVINGTFAQYGIYADTGLVRSPSNLDFKEASTLPCAALTSWNALYGLKQLKPGDTVLVQGTGGVSMFALQFAKAAGARVIATTSSAEKAERVKKLGADHVINYREDKNWGESAKKLTPGGLGVDHIIEVGGADTLPQSLKAVRFEGIIHIIGFLGGPQPKENLMEALNNVCTIRGVYVGSKAMMEDMVAAIEANDIHPVVDEKVFKLADAKKAYEYMWSQAHFGKLTIAID